jgi:hypothetical protein
VKPTIDGVRHAGAATKVAVGIDESSVGAASGAV